MVEAGAVRVLYVDDEPEFADLVEYWLEDDDGDPPLSVTPTTGVEEALEVLANQPIDCVVSDYDMPGRDGLDLLEALRERHSALPFVLFTARGGEETARDAFRAGVTDYMVKDGDPETIRLLAERVRNAVAKRRSTDGATDDHLQYRAGMRDIALDAATNLMSATPDELDTKVSFTLQTVSEFMDIGRAATYLETDGDYERTHTWTADAYAASAADGGTHTEADSETDGPSVDGSAEWTDDDTTNDDTTDDDTTDGDATDDTTDGRADGDVRVMPPPGPLPETLDPAETHAEWLDRVARFETVQYGDPGCHPSAEGTVGPPGRSGVVAPMLSSEFRLIGVTVFDDPESRVWSDEEVDLIETVTELVTRAVERRRQQRELRRQNERLEQFASVVSHDLRNPLAVADGWLDLAADGHEQGFEKVADALDRMEQLIEDVLTLARDGSDIGDVEPVELEAVAREAWSRVNTRDAELSIGGVTVVPADEGRLASVFENLFRNAVEHGGSDTTVEVGPLADGGFYVADDGPGLPTVDEDDLFEWGTTTESDGSGLGLAIVSTVAEAHGWSVTATDSEAGGARFEFDTGTHEDVFDSADSVADTSDGDGASEQLFGGDAATSDGDIDESESSGSDAATSDGDTDESESSGSDATASDEDTDESDPFGGDAAE
ncbi:response regulator [Halobaculum sp. MBLA0147]|uniref:ATP-binding response regulator n=1 Tax=Halobaculum sp. MBLA0147 TaxID=3079934 RepID=UPI0035239306